jgi:hypothetical protein
MVERPTPSEAEIERAARGLSEAQREYLTTKAVFRKPRPWAQARWMTFPPAATLRVLSRQGLVDVNGQILPAGLAVRAHLTGEG